MTLIACLRPHEFTDLLNTACPTRYRTRHWRYCNEISKGVRSLCEKWGGMCL